MSSIRFRLSLYTEEAVICESKIAPLSMPRGTGRAFGDSAPEIETEKCNHFSVQNLIINSPYCLLYDSYDASSENLVLDQLENPYTYPFHYSHHLSD